MSGPFGSSQWMYKSGDYEIDNSLRFNPSESPYLSRTPSAGNRKTWTFSTWIKRGNLGIDIDLLHAYADSGERSQLVFAADDTIKFDFDDYTANRLTTTQKFRDASAWYHIVLAVDTTQGTAANRVKIYVNGNQITAFSAASYPSENEDGHINSAIQHEISSYDGSGSYLDGYLAEVNFIEGTALDASYFGETGDYGEWKPKKYSGAYGNEGFYLDFKSSGVGTASSSTVGADRSGNDNHWTSSGLTVTDQMIDSPTNNFCTMNPILGDALNKTQDGNLTITGTSNNYAVGTIAFGSTGKFYAEANIVNDGGNQLQIATMFAGAESNLGGNENSYYDSGLFYKNASQESTGNATYTTGDIISLSVDVPNATVRFYKNDSLIKTLTSVVDLQEDSFGGYFANSNSKVVWNFGQDGTFSGAETAQGNTDGNDIGDFFYAVPSGFLALCTSNLSEPDVTPSEHFNTVLYTGNGGTPSITGVGFQSGFTWIKARSEVRAHYHFDEVRGVQKALSFDGVGSEDSNSAYLTAFGADGFSLGNSVTVNKNTITYAAWNWKIGGDSGSSNTNGSINTASTSVNSDAGISISTYTGNAEEGATVGHGLSKVPDWIIVSNRGQNGGHTQFHSALGATKNAPLQSYEPISTTSNIWNDTAPTATVFSLGNNGSINGNNSTYVAYCFHSVDGYSKFGSYEGVGNNNGPFVHCGFRPAWIMLKNTAASQHYTMYDTKRSTSNLVDNAVYGDETEAESSAAEHNIDILSNGFKIRNNAAQNNTNNNTYIFMAFAETPFKYSNAR